MMLPRYCEGGFGDVADETEEESKDLVDRFGDRANEGCDGAAMMMISHQTMVSQWQRVNRDNRLEGSD
jgi:hypothetical protein